MRTMQSSVRDAVEMRIARAAPVSGIALAGAGALLTFVLPGEPMVLELPLPGGEVDRSLWISTERAIGIGFLWLASLIGSRVIGRRSAAHLRLPPSGLTVALCGPRVIGRPLPGVRCRCLSHLHHRIIRLRFGRCRRASDALLPVPHDRTGCRHRTPVACKPRRRRDGRLPAPRCTRLAHLPSEHGALITLNARRISAGRSSCAWVRRGAAPPLGLEPRTLRLTVECSAN